MMTLLSDCGMVVIIEPTGSEMNRAFSAALWDVTIFLGRCPRLLMTAAPLALTGYKAVRRGCLPRALRGTTTFRQTPRHRLGRSTSANYCGVGDCPENSLLMAMKCNRVSDVSVHPGKAVPSRVRRWLREPLLHSGSHWLLLCCSVAR